MDRRYRLALAGLCLTLLQFSSADINDQYINEKDKFTKTVVEKAIGSDKYETSSSATSQTQCVCSWSLRTGDGLCGKDKNVKTDSRKDSMSDYIDPSLLMQGDQATHKKTQDELLVSQQVQINQLTQKLEKKSTILNIVEQRASQHLRQIRMLESKLHAQDVSMQNIVQQIQGFQQKTTRNCADVQKIWSQRSGIYNISLPHAVVPVWCDFDTAGGGWTVIQRRYDGSEKFMRDWLEYKKGFGSLDREFWLGNDHIHYLTNQARGLYRLRVDMWDFNNNHAYAEYDQFYTYGEEDNYKLHTGPYNGTAGDSLTFHSGYAFSTIFHDVYNRKCPVRYEGGWWYSDSNTCHITNLNGRYHQHKFRGKNSMSWYYWHNRHLSLRKVEMKVRPSYYH